jgi:transketolase
MPVEATDLETAAVQYAATLQRIAGTLPANVTARVSVEQASTFGWERYVGKAGRMIVMETFGASAPLKELRRRFGFEPGRVVEIAKQLVGRH